MPRQQAAHPQAAHPQAARQHAPQQQAARSQAPRQQTPRQQHAARPQTSRPQTTRPQTTRPHAPQQASRRQALRQQALLQADERYSRGGYQAPRRKRSRRPLAIGIVAIIALLAVALLGFNWWQATRPITVTVDGQDVELAPDTTYQGLRDQGLLTAQNGDFLAIDGSIITAGGGEAYQTFSDGTPVDDYAAKLTAGTDITEQRGADTREQSTSVDTVTPFATTVNGDGSFNFYNGPLHLLTNPGVDGVTSTITGLTSGRVLEGVTTTAEHDRTWESLDSDLPDDQKYIALTFDDGPNPEGTEAVLSALQDNGVKGTFFMLGENVDSYPDLARKVADAGMEIGSHSYSHDAANYLKKLDGEGVRDQLSHAQQSILSATGVTTTMVRPPGGNLNGDNVYESGGYATSFIGWSIGTGDFDRPGVDYIVDQVISNVTPGAVVLMHDGGGDRSQTAEALRVMIPKLKEMGYTCVTVDELIEIKLKAAGRTDVTWNASDTPDVTATSAANASTATATTSASATVGDGDGQSAATADATTAGTATADVGSAGSENV